MGVPPFKETVTWSSAGIFPDYLYTPRIFGRFSWKPLGLHPMVGLVCSNVFFPVLGSGFSYPTFKSCFLLKI